MNGFPFSLEAPGWFAVACFLALVAAGLAYLRRPAVHGWTLTACAVGMVLLALAAGGLTWHRGASAPDVAVMVDLSASTRGASYRNRAELERRVAQLMGGVPYHVSYFSDRNVDSAAGGDLLSDLDGQRTVFAPPAAAAVVLFSDARFEMPRSFAPPVFVVADPELDRAGDAGVDRLEVRGNEVVAHVHNDGAAARRVTVEGAATQPMIALDGGAALAIAREVRKDARVAATRLEGGDRWPENDGLSVAIAPLMQVRRWLVSNGAGHAAGDWVVMKPAALPTDGAAYLAPSVIVLDNLAAGDFSAGQLARLEQYVRDLGGAVVIAGGDRAFAKGLYEGTALEALSPLASAPPTPSLHWMLLADCSGSMSEAVGETTRWRIAAGAVGRLIANLPPEDPVSVGSFAAELTWWSNGRSARETAAMPLPPAGVSPNGPTNLAAALDRIAREADGGLAGELLVVSDADTTIERPADLARRLEDKKIRLHVLAIGDGRGLETLRAMTAATGGTLRRELDPRRWAGEVRRMLMAAWPERLITSAVNVQYAGDLAPLLGGRAVAPWNRTWLKKGASELAWATHEGERVALCGRWAVGNGAVIACGFSPSEAELAAMAGRVARPPRDPRFTVTWDAGPRLVVRVDAVEGGKYLNDLSLRVELADENDAARVSDHDVPQVAPGRYEISLPAPRVRSFATLLHEGRVVDRVAVAGRYAPEFDGIGNDHAAMRALAERTGGRVIDRAWTKPIDFPMPRRAVPLARWLALAAAGMVGLGLVRWRVGD